MDETEASKIGMLTQSPKEDGLGSKLEAEQSELSKHHATNAEGRWGRYAAPVNMSGFGNLVVLDAHRSGCQLNSDRPGQHGEDLQRASLIGNPKATISAQFSDVLNNEFGQSSPPRYGFDNPIWNPQTTTATSTTTPSTGRSLEDLYKDHPEKKLEGIEQSNLDLAANVILQITNEATMQWLNQWCPNMAWSKLIDATKSDTTLVIAGGHYKVPNEATNLGGLTTTVAYLFSQCHKLRSECSSIQLKDLVRISHQCALLCEVLKDQKRKVLLEKSNEIIHWISVGLDCKRISVHKQATDELSKLNQNHRESQKSRPVDEKLSENQMRNRKAKRQEEEAKILDQAVLSFKEHRNTFSKTLLNALQVLMESTNDIW